jgi:hypothetical protein
MAGFGLVIESSYNMLTAKSYNTNAVEFFCQIAKVHATSSQHLESQERLAHNPFPRWFQDIAPSKPLALFSKHLGISSTDILYLCRKATLLGFERVMESRL